MSVSWQSPCHVIFLCHSSVTPINPFGEFWSQSQVAVMTTGFLSRKTRSKFGLRGGRSGNFGAVRIWTCQTAATKLFPKVFLVERQKLKGQKGDFGADKTVDWVAALGYFCGAVARRLRAA